MASLSRSSPSTPYNQSLQYHQIVIHQLSHMEPSIQSLLEGYDLHHFIDNTHTPPPPTVTITSVASPNPTYTTWKYQDRLIFSALLNVISVSLQPLIARTTTSLDAWQILANIYAKPSHGHIKQLKERLQRCTKGSLTYWTYAFAIVVYLINRMPTPTLHLSSSFDKLFESAPNYTKLRINLPTLLLKCFHEATSKNYKSSLASPPKLHLEGSPLCEAPNDAIMCTIGVVQRCYNQAILLQPTSFVTKKASSSRHATANPRCTSGVDL
ncbi:Retrovirus-related Pol polyprotein from transposon RE1 [Vitis vinifera]|uniref:Retrovirus-related Pol polyprotein from transposon RE1 n=1 Tax=Vitis vinifera TaxID=29760 RepID=A0A438FX45_VITVI|nr:Retrovirus-related Pol polyprotein from transposon RE1 [Vitis vinifera]